jgi:RNA polymerase sigma factor (TIGR02999 family)
VAAERLTALHPEPEPKIMTDRPEITRILQQAAAGQPEAVDRLHAALYDELRRLAGHQLGQERADHTLQATALVHEAYLKLVDQTRAQWQDRAHFLAVASLAMRRILVDHARRRRSEKRGSDPLKLTLSAADGVPDAGGSEHSLDLIALDDALAALAADHPQEARLVEMRFFGGLTAGEAAAVLGVTERTAERWWRFARAWLFRRLGQDDSGR